jgi:metal-responsive CopG/Arc/MetJ family transcriptional regulator
VRATISIPDERLQELMELTGAETRTSAINEAIEAYVRQAKLRRLLDLEGRVDILSNEAIEAMDERDARHEDVGAEQGGAHA